MTIGNVTYPLPLRFVVIATQNPIEQSGTFELPEAQLDRFLLCRRFLTIRPEEKKGNPCATCGWGVCRGK